MLQRGSSRAELEMHVDVSQRVAQEQCRYCRSGSSLVAFNLAWNSLAPCFAMRCGSMPVPQLHTVSWNACWPPSKTSVELPCADHVRLRRLLGGECRAGRAVGHAAPAGRSRCTGCCRFVLLRRLSQGGMRQRRAMYGRIIQSSLHVWLCLRLHPSLDPCRCRSCGGVRPAAAAAGHDRRRDPSAAHGGV